MLKNITSVFLGYTHVSEMKGLVTCHSILLDRRKQKKIEDIKEKGKKIPRVLIRFNLTSRGRMHSIPVYQGERREKK